MELSNIVYSTALIFILFLFTIFLIGFLGSAYRKFQMNYSDKKPDAVSDDYFKKRIAEAGEFSHQQSAGKADLQTGINYIEEISDKDKNGPTKIDEVKTVTRGSLVKEQYNAQKLSSFKNGISKTGILFN